MEHGDIFAPYLFSFYAEYILQEMEMKYDFKIGEESITCAMLLTLL